MEEVLKKLVYFKGLRIEDIYYLIKSVFLFPNIKIKDYLFMRKKIFDINEKMIGRYCGSYYDQISQSVATMYVGKKFSNKSVFSHIEIGILFGGSVLTKLSSLERVKRHSQKILAIDPFKGYYEQGLDPSTGMEVSIDNFKKNLDKFEISENRYTIFSNFSQDITPRKAMKKYKIISLMIDGDHSYEGIKRDWELYSQFVVEGGICIIDDYNEKAWPDVTKFADKILKDDLSWKKKAIFDTTLILECVRN